MAALTIGLLIVAAFALPAQKADHGAIRACSTAPPAGRRSTGVVWFLAAVVGIVFTGANTLGSRSPAPLFARNFMLFAFQVEIGQSLVVSAVAILIATVLAAFATRATTLAFATVAGLFALLPLALSGHAAGSLEHANAVNSLAIHLIGVCVVGRRTRRRAAAPHPDEGRHRSRRRALLDPRRLVVRRRRVLGHRERVAPPDRAARPGHDDLRVAHHRQGRDPRAARPRRRRPAPEARARACSARPLDRRSFIRFALAEVVFMASPSASRSRCRAASRRSRRPRRPGGHPLGAHRLPVPADADAAHVS